MYTRTPPGGSRGVRIPRNYSGNAFAPAPEPEEKEQEKKEAEEDVSPPFVNTEALSVAGQESAPPAATPAAKLFPSLGFRSHSGKLFGSFGTEELLLLGLILLLAGNDSSDDLPLLLVLLLFIG